MIHLQKFFLLSTVVCLLNGCAGVAVGTYGKHELAQNNFCLAKGKNNTNCYDDPPEGYTPDEVTSLWGVPDKTEKANNCTVYYYDNGLAWSGGGAFVGVVPVPLLAPTGRYYNRIYFNSGRSVGLIKEYGEVKHAAGVMCGSNKCKALANPVNNNKTEPQNKIKKWCS
ncbi:hypothetical protein [Parashewanella tropica]|uniref:hypothetical protein n=1 Tax=Parashewanella tropica TaxID=2547970 RepID=UPI0010593F60|nr:hypothetical protein [Parashewanella tropica]